MHGVNIFFYSHTSLTIITRLDPGWGLGQTPFMLCFYYLSFYVMSCPYDSFSSICTVRYFSSSCLFVWYM